MSATNTNDRRGGMAGNTNRNEKKKLKKRKEK